MNLSIKNVVRWLNGNYLCCKCDQEVNAMMFGYGLAICPDCYSGEETFFLPDNTFVLNKILNIFIRKKSLNIRLDIPLSLSASTYVSDPEIKIIQDA